MSAICILRMLLCQKKWSSLGDIFKTSKRPSFSGIGKQKMCNQQITDLMTMVLFNTNCPTYVGSINCQKSESLPPPPHPHTHKLVKLKLVTSVSAGVVMYLYITHAVHLNKIKIQRRNLADKVAYNEFREGDKLRNDMTG